MAATPTPEIFAATMVVVGRFNPAIFHPSWLLYHELLVQNEFEDAEIEIVHPDVTKLTIPDFFTLVVEPYRLQLETQNKARMPQVKAILIGILTVLEHTPVESLGLNRHDHYQIASEEKWHGIGDHYAPKETWREVLGEPGMDTVKIKGKRLGSSSEYVDITLQPSKRIDHGLYIAIHEHFKVLSELEPDNETPLDSARKCIEKVEREFVSFQDYVDKTCAKLISIHSE